MLPRRLVFILGQYQVLLVVKLRKNGEKFGKSLENFRFQS